MNSSDKKFLRENWKISYKQYLSQLPIWSREICRLLSENSTFKKAKRIAVYYPREWEVDLLSLCEKKPGCCCFPKTYSKNWEMDFYGVGIFKISEFEPGLGGILEPKATDSQKITQFTADDLILVPGLAFDRVGGRVGSGKGVYDRFLSGLGKLAVKWGVAFSPQIVTTPILLEPHDIRLDGLITEKGFIYF